MIQCLIIFLILNIISFNQQFKEFMCLFFLDLSICYIWYLWLWSRTQCLFEFFGRLYYIIIINKLYGIMNEIMDKKYQKPKKNKIQNYPWAKTPPGQSSSKVTKIKCIWWGPDAMWLFDGISDDPGLYWWGNVAFYAPDPWWQPYFPGIWLYIF